MIPKIIHYCWFGRGPKSELIQKCMASWRKHLSDYEIIEWNEDNFDVNQNRYTEQAYSNKKWAFVSDFARLKALYDQGGIYLDTDMFLLKGLDDCLVYDLVLGKEDEKYISAGMIASAPSSFFLSKVLEKYIAISKEIELSFVTIPKVLTETYDRMDKNTLSNTRVFDSIFFYPFSAEKIHNFDFSNAPQESYAVHMWDYSWGDPVSRFIKKIGAYRLLVYLAEKLNIKEMVKRVIGSI